ncbi:MAG: MBL fold metallo-hydrolase [Christensenellaceae bacterium]|jgi:L-ascorbate metabolism protein UlaG (beta-lactamase superfamily)
MDVKITYLDQSGFYVAVNGLTLVFDYCNNSPVAGKTGLSGGTIGSEDLRGSSVYVFVSHAHGDHYNPVILSWQKLNDQIHYILSGDVRPGKDALGVVPDKEYQTDDFILQTLKSTDEGVAFLLDINGYTIYHAGDLNWWHWEGEPYPWNENMEKEYTSIIDTLKGKTIDLAFVPVDPRLEKDCIRGLDYLMHTADVKTAIPMHFWSQAAYAEKAIRTFPQTKDYRDRVLAPMQRGQSVELK